MLRKSRCPEQEVLHRIAHGERVPLMLRRHLRSCLDCKAALAAIAELALMAADLREASKFKIDAKQRKRLHTLFEQLGPDLAERSHPP